MTDAEPELFTDSLVRCPVCGFGSSDTLADLGGHPGLDWTSGPAARAKAFASFLEATEEPEQVPDFEAPRNLAKLDGLSLAEVAENVRYANEARDQARALGRYDEPEQETR